MKVPLSAEEISRPDPYDERDPAGKKKYADATKRKYRKDRAKQKNTAQDIIPCLQETKSPAH